MSEVLQSEECGVQSGFHGKGSGTSVSSKHILSSMDVVLHGHPSSWFSLHNNDLL